MGYFWIFPLRHLKRHLKSSLKKLLKDILTIKKSTGSYKNDTKLLPDYLKLNGKIKF